MKKSLTKRAEADTIKSWCSTILKTGEKLRKISEKKKKRIERTIANDRSYKVFLYNRFFIFLILVLLQIIGYVWLLYTLVYSSKIAMAVEATVGLLALIAVIYLINRNDRPSMKLNWILLMLIVPIVGVPMYLLYGEGRPAHKIKKQLAASGKENAAAFDSSFGGVKQKNAQTRADTISRFLHRYAGCPAAYDGDVVYYDCGEKMFESMKAELKKAEKFILLEYFILSHGKMWSEILQILLEKAEEGVQIRIIYDDFGCMTSLPPKYDRYLESLHENVKAMRFNKVVPFFAVRMNNRDHRKMLVVDGKAAFTGGINIADEYIGEKQRFGHWKDTGIMVSENAVASFVRMFFHFWNAFYKEKEDLAAYLPPLNTVESGAVIQPYDSSPLDNLSVGENVYVDMIERAKSYVYIFTPYLVLGDSLRAALCRAALRGVDVRIVTPGVPDKKTVYRLTRANYGILLKAGVKIYEYTRGFIHAKSVLCDGESAVVGTINFDYRSFYHHFENAVYFSSCQAVKDLERDCEETFAISTLCTKENTKRSMVGRIVDSLLRVFETLL